MNATDSPRIIFMHIPKTGGTTLRAALRRSYADGTFFLPDVPDENDGRYLRYIREEVESFQFNEDLHKRHLSGFEALDPDAQANVQLFMGHFWYGAHARVPGPCRYFTMLREPIERSLSLYAHRVAHQGLTVPIDRYFQTARDWELDNGQTRRLAGLEIGNPHQPVTERTLEVAKEHLAMFGAVGVTERFNETVLAITTSIARPTLEYGWDNPSSDRAQRDALDPAVLRVHIERNEYDTELHRYAGELLDHSLSGLDVERELRRLAATNRRADRRSQLHQRLYRARVAGSRVKRAVWKRPAPKP